MIDLEIHYVHGSQTFGNLAFTHQEEYLYTTPDDGYNSMRIQSSKWRDDIIESLKAGAQRLHSSHPRPAVSLLLQCFDILPDLISRLFLIVTSVFWWKVLEEPLHRDLPGANIGGKFASLVT